MDNGSNVYETVHGGVGWDDDDVLLYTFLRFYSS